MVNIRYTLNVVAELNLIEKAFTRYWHDQLCVLVMTTKRSTCLSEFSYAQATIKRGIAQSKIDLKCVKFEAEELNQGVISNEIQQYASS